MGFIAFLSIGTVSMFLTLLIVSRIYSIKLWKKILITLLLTIAGVLGTMIMFFIESGYISGRSFFGAVFFTPLLMLLVARLLKISGGVMLDLCAPCECVMLILMKVNCYIEGCCEGYILRYDATGVPIRFPSQIVECINALILYIVLLVFMKNDKFHNTVYYWYMILYGFSRFILNFFRETTPFIWFLSAGHFWSLVSIAIGTLLLVFAKNKNKNKQLNEEKYQY